MCFLRSVSLGAACLVLAGCAPSRPQPARAPVRGAVTLDGKPLAEGTIYFKTEATGRFDAVPIAEGRFVGPAEPGTLFVQITAYEKLTEPAPGAPPPLPENLIPRRYNVQSTLSAEVSLAGPNEFTFDLRSR
jgi:hypothetical protein